MKDSETVVLDGLGEIRFVGTSPIPPDMRQLRVCFEVTYDPQAHLALYLFPQRGVNPEHTPLLHLLNTDKDIEILDTARFRKSRFSFKLVTNKTKKSIDEHELLYETGQRLLNELRWYENFDKQLSEMGTMPIFKR